MNSSTHDAADPIDGGPADPGPTDPGRTDPGSADPVPPTDPGAGVGDDAVISPDDPGAETVEDGPASTDDADPATLPPEVGGQKGPEPTRYGDWEKKGRCTDF